MDTRCYQVFYFIKQREVCRPQFAGLIHLHFLDEIYKYLIDKIAGRRFPPSNTSLYLLCYMSTKLFIFLFMSYKMNQRLLNELGEITFNKTVFGLKKHINLRLLMHNPLNYN